MKEKGSGFGGFIVCFLVSLLYHARWALATVAALVAHFAAGYPFWLFYVGLGIWVLSALISALIITFGNRNHDGPFIRQNNVNPYSKSNSDFGMKDKK